VFCLTLRSCVSGDAQVDGSGDGVEDEHVDDKPPEHAAGSAADE